MKLSTQSKRLVMAFGEERAIEILAKAGYDAVDWTMFADMSRYLARSEDEVREYYTNIREMLDLHGLCCNQTHAPFPSAIGDESRDRKTFALIEKSILASSILGAKVIVVHPIVMQSNRYNSLSAENKALNVEFFSRLIPMLDKYNISVGIENMFNFDHEKKVNCPTACSYSTELADYVDMMNSLCQNGDRFVACLDIGHTTISGEAPIGEMVKTLGSRLKALHVHDNNGIEDLHTAPGFGGKIKFAELCSALREIGYDGEFTFEADQFYVNFDKELLFDAAKLLCKIGRNICEKYGL